MAPRPVHKVLVFVGFSDDGPHRLSGLSPRERDQAAAALRGGRAVGDPHLVPFVAQSAVRLRRLYASEGLLGLCLAILGVAEIATSLASDSNGVGFGVFWLLLGALMVIGCTLIRKRVRAAQLANPVVSSEASSPV